MPTFLEAVADAGGMTGKHREEFLKPQSQPWDSKKEGGFFNGLTQTLGEAADAARGFIGLPTNADREAQQRAMNAQIQAYREQTELTRQELARTRNETSAQKRRVEEKQIRALRRNYRSQRLLGSSTSG